MHMHDVHHQALLSLQLHLQDMAPHPGHSEISRPPPQAKGGTPPAPTNHTPNYKNHML